MQDVPGSERAAAGTGRRREEGRVGEGPGRGAGTRGHARFRSVGDSPGSVKLEQCVGADAPTAGLVSDESPWNADAFV